MGKGRWEWKLGRALGWALPVAAGAGFGVSKTLGFSVAFDNDYTPLLWIVIPFGLALWLGGLRRVGAQDAAKEDDLRRRVAELKTPQDKEG